MLEVLIRFIDFLISPLVAAWIISAIYSAITSPLISLPGKWYYRLTSIPYYIQVIRGRHAHIAHEHHLKYGPLIQIAPDRVSCIDPDISKYLFSVIDLPKSALYDKITMSKVENLFATRDKKWHSQRRKLLNSAFSANSMRELEPYIKETVQVLVQSLKSKDQADMHARFLHYTLDVIGDMAFGGSFNMLTKGHHPFWTAQYRALGFLQIAGGLPILKRLTWLPITKQFHLDNSYIQSFCEKMLKNRRNQMTFNPDSVRHDILQRLIEAKDEVTGQGLQDEDIIAEAALFMLAGSETTSLTLTWWLKCMMQNTLYTRRVQDEIDLLFRVNPDPTMQEITESCPFFVATLEEALRLYPVAAAGTERLVTERPIDLGHGRILPIGVTVMASTFAQMLSPLYFERPDEFLPERFLPDSKIVIDRAAFKPFSLGSRDCIGQRLARLEMILAGAWLMYQFDFQLVPGQNFDSQVRITLNMVGGHLLTKLSQRNIK